MANENNNNNTKPSAPKKYNAISELDAKQNEQISLKISGLYKCDQHYRNM